MTVIGWSVAYLSSEIVFDLTIASRLQPLQLNAVLLEP